MIESVFAPVGSLVGGALIGFSAVVLMALRGKIIGTSIPDGFMSPQSSGTWPWPATVLTGTVGGPLAYFIATGSLPVIDVPVAYPTLVIGGIIVGIGANITVVQETFGKVFNGSTGFRRDGSQFDALFEDRDTCKIGNWTAFVTRTPGHIPRPTPGPTPRPTPRPMPGSKPARMTHVVGNADVVGDPRFMPDGSSARAAFPGGRQGRALRLDPGKWLALPGVTRRFMCDDDRPNRRDVQRETTVTEDRAHNNHSANSANSAPIEAFVKVRTERDAQLAAPRLIIPSLQNSMRAADMPPPDTDGDVNFIVPVNIL